MNGELQTGNGARRWLQRRFGCTGLRIPLPGAWQVELWWCPKGSEITPHVHPSIDSTLVFLGGRMRWRRGSQRREFTARDMFRAFRVPRDCVHSAQTTGRFGLFLNLERWTGPKTSAGFA